MNAAFNESLLVTISVVLLLAVLELKTAFLLPVKLLFNVLGSDSDGQSLVNLLYNFISDCRVFDALELRVFRKVFSHHSISDFSQSLDFRTGESFFRVFAGFHNLLSNLAIL